MDRGIPTSSGADEELARHVRKPRNGVSRGGTGNADVPRHPARNAGALGAIRARLLDAWSKSGHPSENADIAVAVHGFVGEEDRDAKALYLKHELEMFQTGSAEIGRKGMAPPGRANDLERGGMVFASGPNEVADRNFTCTNCSAMRVRSCRWTSAGCPMQPS